MSEKIQIKLKCKECGEVLEADARFCHGCGAKLGGAACPQCNTPVESGWKACPECGTILDEEMRRQQEEQQRREAEERANRQKEEERKKKQDEERKIAAERERAEQEKRSRNDQQNKLQTILEYISSAPQNNQVSFNQLPLAARERLAEYLNEKGASTLSIKQVDSYSDKKGRSVFGIVIGFIMLALLSWYNFAAIGDLSDKSYGYQPAIFIIGYAIISSILVFNFIGFLRNSRAKEAFPVNDGTYVLPLDIITVLSGEIHVLPLSGLDDTEMTEHRENGAYKKTDIIFKLTNRNITVTYTNSSQAESDVEKYNDFRRRVREAIENRDMAELMLLDPFASARKSDRWVADTGKAEITGPHFKILPPLLQSGSALFYKLAIAVAVGVIAWFARNAASNYKALSEVIRIDSETKYEEYLKQGYFMKKAEVQNVLMPKAAFREAIASKKIAPLRAFINKYPNSEYLSEARKELSSAYDSALQKYSSSVKNVSRGNIQYIANLLSFLKQSNSPAVNVFFRRPTTEALKEMDDYIKNKASGVTDVMPVAEYFSDSDIKKKEEFVFNQLKKGFGKVFDDEILVLNHFTGSVETIDKKSPVIDIDYSVVPTGSLYSHENSQLNKEKYLGIKFIFRIKSSIPGSSEQHFLALSVNPPSSFHVSSSKLSGLSTSSVYDTMANHALEQVGDKILSTFLGTSIKFNE